MSGQRRSARQERWLSSAAFRAATMRGLRNAWAVNAAKPRCGAKARSTGEPCHAYALANGRCRCHGGLVPKGPGKWHKVQANGSPGLGKWARKADALAKREKHRKDRVAAMTPEQRARYDEWHRQHPTEGRGAPQKITREFLDELMQRDAEAHRTTPRCEGFEQ